MFVLETGFRRTAGIGGGRWGMGGCGIPEFWAGISTQGAPSRSAKAFNSPQLPQHLLLAVLCTSMPAHPRESLGSRAMTPSRHWPRLKITLFACLFLTQLRACSQLIVQPPQLGQGRGKLSRATGITIQVRVLSKRSYSTNANNNLKPSSYFTHKTSLERLHF